MQGPKRHNSSSTLASSGGQPAHPSQRLCLGPSQAAQAQPHEEGMVEEGKEGGWSAADGKWVTSGRWCGACGVYNCSCPMDGCNSVDEDDLELSGYPCRDDFNFD